MKKCSNPQCNREFSDDMSFCPYCGTKWRPQKRVCPNCGFDDIPEGANFCPKCRWNLSKDIMVGQSHVVKPKTEESNEATNRVEDSKTKNNWQDKSKVFTGKESLSNKKKVGRLLAIVIPIVLVVGILINVEESRTIGSFIEMLLGAYFFSGALYYGIFDDE